MKEILNIIHNTIYQFIDVCGDDEEVPMSDKDKLLLEVNKAICNNLKTLEQEPKWIPIRIKSPQQGQRVFISTIKGTIHDEIWDMNRIYNYATDGCWYRNWFVIAWMPFFIEPYKAGSDDRNEI